MRYIVVLGKEGKIAKSLYKGLKANSRKVISLNWKFIEKVISNNINLEKTLFSFFNIRENSCEFEIINCLKENTLEKKFQDIHLKLFEIFKTFTNKISYFFLSTYEANKFPHTKYRKIKNLLEKIVEENGGFIIRIGYFLDKSDLDIIKSNKNRTLITNMKKKIILVPVTFDIDLIKLLNKKITSKYKGKIITCYSNFCAISVCLKYPFFKLFDLKEEILYSLVIPLKFLSKFFLFISYILRRIRLFNNLSDLLEKPYALYLFQRIIYKDEI